MPETDARRPADDDPYDLIIAGGLVVTGERPAAPGDVAVRGESIARVAARIEAPCRRRIDARGLVVMPGLIDPHVHLSLPMKGTVSSDDPSSGTLAALYGGVTTIIDFTLPRPGERLWESLERRQGEFAGRAHTDYAFHANVTWFPDDFAERLPEELDELVARGVTTLKVFTCYSREGYLIHRDDLRALLRAASTRGLLVLVHAEDDALVEASTARLESAGRAAPADYPLSRPAEAEARAIAAVAAAARAEGAPVYFVHVSSAAGLEAALSGHLADLAEPRLAPAGSQLDLAEPRRPPAGRQPSRSPVYVETCPHYLALDETRFAGSQGAQYLVAPPLRAAGDREALLRALAGGHIDVVATDHCPFRRAQKNMSGAPFTLIPNGLPGVETRLPLLHTLAVVPGRLTLERLVALAATQPAAIHGLAPRKGAIRPGADADLTLFDPAVEWRLAASALHMNTDFSPYEETIVRGRVRSVLLRGRMVIEEDEWRGALDGAGEPGRSVAPGAPGVPGEPSGRFVARRPAEAARRGGGQT